MGSMAVPSLAIRVDMASTMYSPHPRESSGAPRLSAFYSICLTFCGRIDEIGMVKSGIHAVASPLPLLDDLAVPIERIGRESLRSRDVLSPRAQ